MRLVAPPDSAQHLAFRIGDGPNASGPRLGGNAPALVSAPRLDPSAQYVLTIPFLLQPTVYVSLYVNCPVSTFWEAMNTGLQADERVVVVRHGEITRGNATANRSDVSSHPLYIEKAPATDLVDDGEGGRVIASSHKIGGRPYCIQEPELGGAEDLLCQGYVQALQLDFPGSCDGDVSGPWPFADGLFNLFLKEDSGAPAFWAFQK